MKKLMNISLIILGVGLVLILVGGLLRSIQFDASFTPANLANAFFSIGYLATVLTGVILAAGAVVSIVKGGDVKKLILWSVIIVGVGLTLVLTAAVLQSITTWPALIATNVGAFNPTAGTALAGAMNSVGYLAATLGGVVLVAASVLGLIKPEEKEKK
ncbi:MAG: hypothetical protein FWE53_05275 [Firmicutes bacterium]|nr:hypothetical protein [Bacillota bacterium]